MAMAGLFWIAGGDVYVGAKPSGPAPGVRLAPEGVVALGDGQSGLFPWEDVRALTVADVPVRSLVRKARAVKDVALETVLNLALPNGPGFVDKAPPLMTVHVETTAGARELSAFVAAAAGYPPAEIELSRTLLSRLTEGGATMATTLAAMSDWGRSWEGRSPRGPEREALLRKWAG
ncbi:hypothetical protein AB0I49_13985 [Streptomyces sp. NPDC050617]|uniref:hypothetical protein n=1 Tax=Streptomyces sp. NPDC050617 TaxID=3154628 RepID=UPI0034164E72